MFPGGHDVISAHLTTPLEIFEAAQMFFPTTQLTKMQDVPLHVRLTLGHEIQPLLITNGLYKIPFLLALQEIALAQLSVKHSDLVVTPANLDATRFSIASPLSNWTQFQRAIFTRNGKRCEDAIKEYLAASSAEPIPNQLRILEFAPDQVEGHLTDDTLNYFKSAIKGLPFTDPKIVNLRIRYPLTTRDIANSFLNEELAKPIEDKYGPILEHLQRQVIGQDHANAEIASFLAHNHSDENSVFLFVGPSGIGKTELAKAAATLKNNRMITFNMNQFSDSHSTTTFFGSPASYLGSDDKSQLAKELEKYPEAITKIDDKNVIVTGLIILFDEFEKAHSDLRQSLLTLFDEGYCTIRYTTRSSSEGDSKNVSIKYTLKDCIIVNTSNLCQDAIYNAFLRHFPVDGIVEAFKTENKILQRNPLAKSFSDELLNRMKVIPFGPIPRGDKYQHLLEIKLNKFLLKMKNEIGCKEIEVENRRLVLEILEEKLYGNGIDIRRVERFYKSIENKAIQHKSRWGDIRQVKITLYPEAGVRMLGMKLSTYSELAASYIQIPGIAPYMISEEYSGHSLR